jgi:hypothetical protein
MSGASEETRQEYYDLRDQQKKYHHLKCMGLYDTLLKLLLSNPTEMFDEVIKLPRENKFVEFIMYALLDFLLNVKRSESYKQNDERTIFCEVFIPLFKAFGNCTQSLGYTWYIKF